MHDTKVLFENKPMRMHCTNAAMGIILHNLQYARTQQRLLQFFEIDLLFASVEYFSSLQRHLLSQNSSEMHQQWNPAYCIPHIRDNFNLGIRKSLNRCRTLLKRIKFKDVSLFRFKDTEIRRRNYSNFHVSKVYWSLTRCAGNLGVLTL